MTTKLPDDNFLKFAKNHNQDLGAIANYLIVILQHFSKVSSDLIQLKSQENLTDFDRSRQDSLEYLAKNLIEIFDKNLGKFVRNSMVFPEIVKQTTDKFTKETDNLLAVYTSEKSAPKIL